MGSIVSAFRTGLGCTDVMQVNPFNGVVATGHSGGTVAMRKPTSSTPLMKILCHPGPVSALAFHANGNLMATSGVERKIKISDLRKFEPLQTLPGFAKKLNFSQKGLLACGSGSSVQVTADFSGSRNYSRYMSHSMVKGYQMEKLLFRPYEDVLGIGHSMGWSSILIPGSGEPNFDSWVANPFETSKQQREKEVRSLLNKLPPETIMLDPSRIGTIKLAKKKERKTKLEKEAEKEAAIDAAKSVGLKKKTKGRNKAGNRVERKNDIVERGKRPFMQQEMKEEEGFSTKRQKVNEEAPLPKALHRFVRKNVAMSP